MGPIREECRFRTPRLDVGIWDGSLGDDRAALIGDDDNDEDEGSTTLMASRSGNPVGLLILFEDPCSAGSHADLRIGYLIDEQARSQGFATELVAGLVQWCRQRPWVRSLSGGVESENVASALVLTRNGFVQQTSTRRGAVEYLLEL
jgi:RimJ/RimL family protein N-acetyltransferase